MTKVRCFAMRRVLGLVLCFVMTAMTAMGLGGCATYGDELSRGQTAYEKNEYERALATFRALEQDQPRLSDTQRARYAYLRGMTDYRIGYRADARHWLAVAKAMEDATPGSVPSDWKTRLVDTLNGLNEDVYNNGYESLANKRAKDVDVDVDRPAKKTKTDE